MSLTQIERDLIRAAETTMWNEDLRWLLAGAVGRRGGRVGTHDNCGELADFLEMLGADREHLGISGESAEAENAR